MLFILFNLDSTKANESKTVLNKVKTEENYSHKIDASQNVNMANEGSVVNKLKYYKMIVIELFSVYYLYYLK